MAACTCTRAAFGPVVGFEVGWLLIWTRVLSAAANPNLFVLCLAELWPEVAADAPRAVVMLVLAGTVAITNVIGVRGAAWAIDFLTIAKLAPLALLIVLGLPQIDADTLAGQVAADPDWTQAILIMMFAFSGFESALLPAGEMRDPKRDLAFALLVRLAIVAAVYVLVQLVVVGVVVAAAAAARKAPLASTSGILLFAAASLALAGSFAGNAIFSAIVRLVYYALTCAALIVLRRK